MLSASLPGPSSSFLYMGCVTLWVVDPSAAFWVCVWSSAGHEFTLLVVDPSAASGVCVPVFDSVFVFARLFMQSLLGS